MTSTVRDGLLRERRVRRWVPFNRPRADAGVVRQMIALHEADETGTCMYDDYPMPCPELELLNSLRG